MERAHIRCIPFNPVVPLVSLVMNHRDHRKIVVVDGNTAYTGGINLADEYINEEERFGYWKDAALRTEGAAVWNFTVMFLDHWNAFRPSEEDYAPFMPQAEALSALVRFIRYLYLLYNQIYIYNLWLPEIFTIVSASR
jgi:cardiolipin synthase